MAQPCSTTTRSSRSDHPTNRNPALLASPGFLVSTRQGGAVRMGQNRCTHQDSAHHEIDLENARCGGLPARRCPCGPARAGGAIRIRSCMGQRDEGCPGFHALRCTGRGQRCARRGIEGRQVNMHEPPGRKTRLPMKRRSVAILMAGTPSPAWREMCSRLFRKRRCITGATSTKAGPGLRRCS